MFMLPGPLSDGGSVSMCVGYSVSVGREIYSAIPTALAHRAEVEQLFGADWEMITVFFSFAFECVQAKEPETR